MLTVYTLEQSEQWDEVVCSFAEYDVYWLSGYVKAFQIHGDGTPLLFYYEGENGRGINVVMKRDIAGIEALRGFLNKNELFDFATPYGYGGWLVEGEENSFQEYEAYCKENNIVSEFVRFHPILHNQVKCSMDYEVIELGNTVAIDLLSPKKIWENITSKNRNVIRKAEKNNIEIKQGRSKELFETFRTIYNSTMDKDNAEEYYYFGKDFYQSILHDLSDNSQIFYAEREGKIIAASIILNANKKLNYHLSGSLREYSNLAPTNLLLYKVALWGCENGYKTLYLGGGVGCEEDGLFKFKRAFNRTDELINRFYIGKRIFIPEVYKDLIEKRKDIVGENRYFPAYRLSIDVVENIK